jgi:hypothetical protein
MPAACPRCLHPACFWSGTGTACAPQRGAAAPIRWVGPKRAVRKANRGRSSLWQQEVHWRSSLFDVWSMCLHMGALPDLPHARHEYTSGVCFSVCLLLAVCAWKPVVMLHYVSTAPPSPILCVCCRCLGHPANALCAWGPPLVSAATMVRRVGCMTHPIALFATQQPRCRRCSSGCVCQAVSEPARQAVPLCRHVGHLHAVVPPVRCSLKRGTWQHCLRNPCSYGVPWTCSCCCCC